MRNYPQAHGNHHVAVDVPGYCTVGHCELSRELQVSAHSADCSDDPDRTNNIAFDSCNGCAGYWPVISHLNPLLAGPFSVVNYPAVKVEHPFLLNKCRCEPSFTKSTGDRNVLPQCQRAGDSLGVSCHLDIVRYPGSVINRPSIHLGSPIIKHSVLAILTSILSTAMFRFRRQWMRLVECGKIEPPQHTSYGNRAS